MGINLHQKSRSFNASYYSAWSVKHFPYTKTLVYQGYSYTALFIHHPKVTLKL